MHHEGACSGLGGGLFGVVPREGQEAVGRDPGVTSGLPEQAAYFASVAFTPVPASAISSLPISSAIIGSLSRRSSKAFASG